MGVCSAVLVGVSGCVQLLLVAVLACVTVYRNTAIELSNPEYWTQGFHLTCKADGSLAIPNFLQAVAESVSAPPGVCVHQCRLGDLFECASEQHACIFICRFCQQGNHWYLCTVFLW